MAGKTATRGTATSVACAFSLTSLIMVLQPAALVAQQSTEGVAGLPRPKVSSDAQYDLARGGYPVRIFFQEGRSFTHHDAHVFYEPLIYLQTDDHGTPIRHIDDTGDLILYFQVETDTDFLQEALRVRLIKTAQTTSKTDLDPQSLRYRIDPIHLSEFWFESKSRRKGLDSPRLKSEITREKPIVEKGRLPIYFPGITRETAQKFVEDLRTGRDSLLLRYTFSGVSDEICRAEITAENVQGTDLFKEVVGGGGQGRVIRHQVVNLANEIATTESTRTRCADPGWATALARKIIERLATYETVPINDWDTLDELTTFDAESFKADVTEETKNIEKEAVHSQVMEAVAEGISLAKSDTGEAGVALGYKGFMIGASGSLSESKASTAAEARKVFAEVMKKLGILGEWKGTQYIPKSVDVYTKADMDRAWRKNLQVEYAFTAGTTADHTVELTRKSHLSSVNRAKDVELLGSMLREELRSALQKVSAKLDELESDLATTKKATERASRTAGTAQSMAEDAVETSMNARGMASRAESVATGAWNTAVRAQSKVRGIFTRSYHFDLREGYFELYYDTGVSVDEYPLAFVPEFVFYHECDGYNDFQNARAAQRNARWYIIFSRGDANGDCSRVAVVMFFIESDLVISHSSWRLSDLNDMAAAVLR